MVAILELPDVRERVAPLSVEDYERMAERVGRQRIELIRGIIIEKVTSSPFHSYLIGQLQTLVQAVLNDENHLRQDQEKAFLYAEAGVAEYWIVLANDESIEVHTLPVAGRYTSRCVYGRGEPLSSVALPALRVDLDALFGA